MKETPIAEVEEYLSKLDPPIRKLARQLRIVVLEAVPDLNEVIKWGSLVYEKKEKICSIMVHRSHVNLQIWRGAELADPERLLEGIGKGMRHVKVGNSGDIKVDAFKRLIKEAAELRARAGLFSRYLDGFAKLRPRESGNLRRIEDSSRGYIRKILKYWQKARISDQYGIY